MCLNKEQFDELMKIFPDHKSFLLRVGRQRMRTCEPDSVRQQPLPYIPYDEIINIDKSDHQIECKLFSKKFIKTNINIAEAIKR
jgi:hypothetical protein